MPNSVSATLPIPFRGAQVVEINLSADIPSEFSLRVTINAIPHVRIIARAGVEPGEQRATAGLVIESTRTVCRAPEPETSRARLQSAGEQLRDAIRTLQNPPPSAEGADPAMENLDRLRAVGTAIYGVHQAIEESRRGCREVPRVRFDLGARIPYGLPEPGGGPGSAPYLGGTLTIPF
ncbi:MAG: hypothetical protein HC880_10000 [Bacteroidia bacterium]|nr:hypothetical protein [Bacteroidia bacterium]